MFSTLAHFLIWSFILLELWLNILRDFFFSSFKCQSKKISFFSLFDSRIVSFPVDKGQVP